MQTCVHSQTITELALSFDAELRPLEGLNPKLALMTGYAALRHANANKQTLLLIYVIPIDSSSTCVRISRFFPNQCSGFAFPLYETKRDSFVRRN